MAAETVSIWATLAPVIVGGVIGLAGGLIGPPLSHWLSEKTNRKKKRAEKLEELVCLLYEHRHWLDVVEGIRVFGNEGQKPLSPLPRAVAITAIDFPQFSGLLSELEELARAYEHWMWSAAQKRLAGNMQDLNDGLNGAYPPYSGKLNEIVDALKVYANAEFND